MEEKEKNMKKYSLSLTEEEINADILDLQNDPSIKAFLDIQEGARKFQKLMVLQKIVHGTTIKQPYRL